MNIKELIISGIKKLEEKEDASIIAKKVAENVLKLDKIKLIVEENAKVSDIQVQEYNEKIDKILKGIPLQYITNEQEFMGYNFYVDENVLIPQPDTETLVEEVINIAKNMKKVEILDICTGSGCIGISLANIIENAKITISDVSSKALYVARKNVKKYNLDNKIEIIESDMFQNINKKYDIIVSNPPYIETDVIKKLDIEVQNEPILALNGGQDGLDFYKILIKESFNYLKDKGFLCMEIGYNQKENVIKLAKQNEFYCKKDIAGNDRVIVIKK